MTDRDTTTILAVDDERHIRELLRMARAMQGFEVVEAASGREALAVVERERPDLSSST